MLCCVSVISVFTAQAVKRIVVDRTDDPGAVFAVIVIVTPPSPDPVAGAMEAHAGAPTRAAAHATSDDMLREKVCPAFVLVMVSPVVKLPTLKEQGRVSVRCAITYFSLYGSTAPSCTVRGDDMKRSLK